MGATKVDLTKTERDWYTVTLSDPETVKGLIKLRSEYDLLFERSNGGLDNTNIDLNNQLEEVTCTYVWLDDILRRISFTEQQDKLIKMLMRGYEVEDFAEFEGLAVSTVNTMFDRVCKKISEMSQREWRKFTYTKKLNLKTKKCSKCGEDLPATEEFFGNDDKRNDGFSHRCKICDSRRKK